MRIKHALMTSVFLCIGWVAVHSVHSWRLLNGWLEYVQGGLLVIALGIVSGIILFPLCYFLIRSGEDYQARRSRQKIERENISG